MSGTASGDFSTETGSSSYASALQSTATGANSNAEGENSTATGSNSATLGANSTATGVGSIAGGVLISYVDGAPVITVIGNNSTANGAASKAIANDSVAIRAQAAAGTTGCPAGTFRTLADATLCSPNGSGVAGEPGVVAQLYPTAAGVGAIAVGKSASAVADESISVGKDSNVAFNAVDSFAIGRNANVISGVTNSVALGAGSMATESNTISVGFSGGERRVVNVAGGVNAHDAVNKAQLDVQQLGQGGQAWQLVQLNQLLQFLDQLGLMPVSNQDQQAQAKNPAQACQRTRLNGLPNA